MAIQQTPEPALGYRASGSNRSGCCPRSTGDRRFGHSDLADVDWITAARTLADSGADVVGFNCGRSFRTMRGLLAELRAATKAYIAAVPVPYHTTAELPAFQFLQEPDGSSAYTLSLEHFLYSRQEVADDTTGLLDLGVNYFGLCCGNAPHYTRTMAERMGRRVPSSRFSPDLSQHSLLGSAAFVNPSERRFLRHWRRPGLDSTPRARGLPRAR